MFQILISMLVAVTLSAPLDGGAEKDHWRLPLAHQQGWSVEDLHPDTCRTCHQEQFDGWRGSRHAIAAGPGLLAQFHPADDPSFVESCQNCHAPLAEQAEYRWGENEYQPNQRYDATLLATGVGCAACHLREGKVYGPPLRQEPPLRLSGEGAGHGQITPSALFGKAEFCATCHQLDDGYVLNGKPLTNTYREWLTTDYAEKGVVCQDCHMPDRAHVWRGIHDPAMVRQALDSRIGRHGKGYRLSVTNVGAGHSVPSYVTPMIVVRGFVQDDKGSVLEGSEQEAYIGRKVSLDLETEIFDTRIEPGATFTFDYLPPDGAKGAVVVELTVYPDNFYANFFASSLAAEGGGLHLDPLRQVVEETSTSSYRLERFALPLE